MEVGCGSGGSWVRWVKKTVGSAWAWPGSVFCPKLWVNGGSWVTCVVGHVGRVSIFSHIWVGHVGRVSIFMTHISSAIE